MTVGGESIRVGSNDLRHGCGRTVPTPGSPFHYDARA